MACPLFEMSWPAPATVWQAVSASVLPSSINAMSRVISVLRSSHRLLEPQQAAYPVCDVTAKTIEDAIAFLKTSSPKASFEQRKDFALSMHSVEVGRRCTLRQSGAATATLDIRFPE